MRGGVVGSGGEGERGRRRTEREGKTSESSIFGVSILRCLEQEKYRSFPYVHVAGLVKQVNQLLTGP